MISAALYYQWKTRLDPILFQTAEVYKDSDRSMLVNKPNNLYFAVHMFSYALPKE